MTIRVSYLAPLALLLVPFGTTVRTNAGTCLPFAPEPVVGSGRLSREAFPGPPTYESLYSGDSPEAGFYLTPAGSLCFGAVPDDELNSSDSSITHLQLVLDSLGCERSGST